MTSETIQKWRAKVAQLPPLTDDERHLMLAGRAACRLHTPAQSTNGLWPLDKWPAAGSEDELLPLTASPMKSIKRPTYSVVAARPRKRMSIKERRVLSLAEVLARRQAAA